MLHVEGRQIEAQMQSGGADDQVREINTHSPSHLLSMNSTCQPRYVQRKWVNGDSLA